MKMLKHKKIIILVFFILTVSGCLIVYQSWKQSVYASSREVIQNQALDIPQNDTEIDIYQIIEKNTNQATKEEMITEEIDLEYTTIYQNNDNLAKGTMQVLQEGRNGLQRVTIKNCYENGILLTSKQIETKVIKASISKIVEIGTAKNKVETKVNIGDTLYITPSTVSVRIEPDNHAEKIITLNQKEAVTLLQKKDEWYQISYQNYIGWIEKNCTKTKNLEQEEAETTDVYTKQQLIQKVNKQMVLNKPSGFSLEQFKKVLGGNREDKNKIFEQNAQYFYYVEKQYNINGIFIAAVGIHESGWGTSKIAIDKKNLFGYGAYDNSAYYSSYAFGSYAEGIDLIARVFTKYYLHPKGSKIYDGEVANGKYYSGSTLSSVNQRYATDTNWANGVYKWIEYLYHKL